MDYYALIGIISVVVGLIGFAPYYRDVLRGRTKPHAFSWLIWALMQAITFFAQLSQGGGAGTWFVGTAAVLCFGVFVLSLFKGDREIVLLDKMSLLAGLVGIGFWIVTSNPLGAVVIACLVDAAGFVPTYRKAYKRPGEETLIEYGTSALGFVLSLFALQAINLTTVLYPVSVTITNVVFIVMVMIRRRGKRVR